MAKLIDCKKCGHEVSKTDKKCPNCGSKMSDQRTSGFTWVVVIVFGFSLFFILSPGTFTAVSNLFPSKLTTASNFISDKLTTTSDFISDKLTSSSTSKPASSARTTNTISKPTISKPKGDWNYWVSEDEFTHEDVHHAHLKTNDVQPWIVCRTKDKELEIFFEVGELISNGDFRPEGVKVEYHFDLEPIETTNFSASKGLSVSAGRNYLLLPANKYSEFVTGLTNGGKLQLRVYDYQGSSYYAEIPLGGTATTIPKVLQACS